MSYHSTPQSSVFEVTLQHIKPKINTIFTPVQTKGLPRFFHHLYNAKSFVFNK